MDMEKVVLYAVLVVTGVLIASLIVSPMAFQNRVEAANAGQISDRAAGSVWAGEPQVAVSSIEDGSEFVYSITATMKLGFDGKTANEITMFPVVQFKGAKERDLAASEITEITLKKGEVKQFTFNFKLRSAEKPMVRKVNDMSFKCSDYERGNLGDCTVRDNQKLLLKDFSFAFSGRQIDSSVIPFMPSFVKIGPCFLSVDIACPFEKKNVNLRLDDEGKTCYKQGARSTECGKVEKMCGTIVNINLTKINTAEGFFERIMPGSPSCSDKLFVVSIDVGRIDKSVTGGQYAWAVGEDITFIFWEKSPAPRLQNCWMESTEECTKLYIGEKTTTIPIEGYV